MAKTITDELCDRISDILDELPRITKKIDSLNSQILKGGISSKEMTDIIRERSILIEKRRALEAEAKTMYRVKLEETHEVELIGGIANQQFS